MNYSGRSSSTLRYEWRFGVLRSVTAMEAGGVHTENGCALCANGYAAFIYFTLKMRRVRNTAAPSAIVAPDSGWTMDVIVESIRASLQPKNYNNNNSQLYCEHIRQQNELRSPIYIIYIILLAFHFAS